MIVLSSFIPLAFAGDQLIYNNSNETGYYALPGAYEEWIDYGYSPGGYITRLRFKYYSESSYSGNVTVRFYNGTSYTYDGYQIKGFTISNLSTSSGFNTVDYQIPADQQFTLPGGNFGYSLTFSRSDNGPVLASGGQGSDTYFWYYDDFYDD